MSQKIVVKDYCSDDLKDVKEILFEYSSPTGRVWSGGMVKEMFSDALREQSDGVFAAEISGKIAGFAIAIYRDWFNIAVSRLHTNRDRVNQQRCRS